MPGGSHLFHSVGKALGAGWGRNREGQGVEEHQVMVQEQEQEHRGQIRPAILQNPGMDTFCPTKPVCPRKYTPILL